VVITTEVDTCGNIQDFSEYVEEIRDIFKRMVILLKIPKFDHIEYSTKGELWHVIRTEHLRIESVTKWLTR